jgi:hypothetical protein
MKSNEGEIERERREREEGREKERAETDRLSGEQLIEA